MPGSIGTAGSSKADKGSLCIATLDPEFYGVVVSMVEAVYRPAVEEGYDPFLVYNSLARAEDVTLPRLLRGRRARLKEERIGMFRGFSINRVLPELEFLNYRANRKSWSRAMEAGDRFLAIGGSSLCAYPFAVASKPFLLWVATTLHEDRMDRVQQASWWKRARDYASLPILLRQEERVFRSAAHVFALSGYTRRTILDKYAIEAARVEVMPPPIDTGVFRPVPFSERRRDYVLFTGRFDDQRKNLPLLLRAFARVRSVHPRLRLRLVGGELPPAARKLAEELGVSGATDVIGRLPSRELAPHYQQSALFAIPSFQEGLCISGLEALACGIPVVSTRCGGPEDFVLDRENGLLVENDDADALAGAMLELLSLSEDDQMRMSARARRLITEEYTLEQLWPRFRRALSDGMGPPALERAGPHPRRTRRDAS